MPYADPEVRKVYQREWIARRKAEYFADKTCARCASRDDLRLDHIDPNQKVSHTIWSWSTARREAELVKCQVLCEPCHKDKTIQDFNHLQHGTPSMYRNHGCRCPECTQGNTEAKRRVRAKACSKRDSNSH